MKNQDVNQTFWEHLDVLRGALIRIASIAAIVSVVAFCFKEALFQVVLAPKQNDFITYEWLNRIAVGMGAAPTSFSIELINTSLAQQFLIHMKTALFAGLLGASPYALYQLIRFITPALYTEERKPVYRVIGWGYTLFLVGLLIGYFLIFPLTFRFLGTYQVSSEVENLISLDSYISTMMGMCMVLGLIFELPILSWLLGRFGLLTPDRMRHFRRHAIVCILLIAALITPTSDIFTLTIVSLPMWMLYELSIVVVAKSAARR